MSRSAVAFVFVSLLLLAASAAARAEETGKMVRHYALSNEKECFAELTEAWLGTNDYYPFVQAELLEHDPQGAKVMEGIRGK